MTTPRIVPVCDSEYMYVACDPEMSRAEICDWVMQQDLEFAYGPVSDNWPFFFDEYEMLGMTEVRSGYYRWVPTPGCEFDRMLYPAKPGRGAFFVRIFVIELKEKVG